MIGDRITHPGVEAGIGAARLAQLRRTVGQAFIDWIAEAGRNGIDDVIIEPDARGQSQLRHSPTIFEASAVSSVLATGELALTTRNLAAGTLQYGYLYR